MRRRDVPTEVGRGAGVRQRAEERHRAEHHRVREGVHVGAGAAVCRLRAPPPQPRPESGVPPLLPKHPEVEAPAPRRTLHRYASIIEFRLTFPLRYIGKKPTHLFYIDDLVRTQENVLSLKGTFHRWRHEYVLKLGPICSRILK